MSNKSVNLIFTALSQYLVQVVSKLQQKGSFLMSVCFADLYIIYNLVVVEYDSSQG